MKTKLLLIIVACIGLSLTSCKKEPDEKTKPQTNVEEGSTEYKSSLTVLGKGVDVTGSYCYVSRTIQNVFDYDALYKGGKIQKNDNLAWARAESQEGQSISEYQNKFSAAISRNAGVEGLFSAETKTRFSIGNSVAEEVQFSTYNVNVKKYALYVTLSDDVDAMQPYLSSAFLKSVENTDFTNASQAASFIAKYGTHICMGGIWGGTMSFNMSARKKTKSIDTSLSTFVGASVTADGISVGGSIEFQNDFSAKFENSTLKVNVVATGGKPEKAAILAANINGKPLGTTDKSGYKDWLDSIDANPAFCDYYNEGLIGVWEVVADNDKRAQIEAAVKSYCASKGITSYSSKKLVEATGIFRISGSDNGLVQQIGGGDGQMSTSNGKATGVMIQMSLEIGEDCNVYGVVQNIEYQEGGYTSNNGNTRFVINPEITPYKVKLKLSESVGKPVWDIATQSTWDFKGLVLDKQWGDKLFTDLGNNNKIQVSNESKDDYFCPFVPNLTINIDTDNASNGNDRPNSCLKGDFKCQVYVCN